MLAILSSVAKQSQRDRAEKERTVGLLNLKKLVHCYSIYAVAATTQFVFNMTEEFGLKALVIIFEIL